MQAFKSNIIEANEVTILLHGGVGRIHKEAISPETERQYQEAIIHALTEGQKIISCGGKSIDAVEKVISILAPTQAIPSEARTFILGKFYAKANGGRET